MCIMVSLLSITNTPCNGHSSDLLPVLGNPDQPTLRVPVEPFPEVGPHGLRHAGSLDKFNRTHEMFFCTSMVSGLAAIRIDLTESFLAGDSIFILILRHFW